MRIWYGGYFWHKMDKEYKKNIEELHQILQFLENDSSDLDTAKKKVEIGKTKIRNCLEMLNKSEGTIQIVTMKDRKLTFENFDK